MTPALNDQLSAIEARADHAPLFVTESESALALLKARNDVAALCKLARAQEEVILTLRTALQAMKLHAFPPSWDDNGAFDGALKQSYAALVAAELDVAGILKGA